MNKCLTELPRSKSGKTILWRNIPIGKIIELEYFGNIYTLSLVAYKNGRLWFNYNGYIKNSGIVAGDFNKGKYGGILKIITRDFKIEIGESISDSKRDIKIIDREYKNNNKYYKYHCNKCTNEDLMTEYQLLDKHTNCNACCVTPQKAVLGINTIWDKARWMCDLGVSEEDAKGNTHGSNKKIEVICPYCGNKKKISPNAIYSSKSISCTCGDGFSYPEKFMSNLLTQLGVEFETEYSPDWSDGKFYDFYISSFHIIIETHGEQHYRDNTQFKRTLEEEQENDKLKRELALCNGIEHYIILDCRKSELEYIKNSILNSKLNELFDLTNINWLKCEEFALSNLVKEVCEYWKNKKEWETTKDVGKVFNLSREAIIRYLKKGSKQKWCEYDPKEESKKGSIKAGKSNGKQVEIFKDGILLGTFESCSELERQSEELFGVKLNYKNISAVCIGDRKNYKGFTFKYN